MSEVKERKSHSALDGSKVDAFKLDPNDVLIELDPEHPLFGKVNDQNYDKRVLIPMSHPKIQGMVDFMLEKGTAPGTFITVRKNGSGPPIVTDGRTRTRCMRAANAIIAKMNEGLPEDEQRPLLKILVASPVKGTEAQHREFGIIVNRNRLESPPSVLAQEASDLLQTRSREYVLKRMVFDSEAQLDALLRLLDCTQQVRDAVDAGELSISAATQISRLEVTKQDVALSAVRDVNATKTSTESSPESKKSRTSTATVAEVADIVRGVKSGENAPVKPAPKPIRGLTRAEIAEIYESSEITTSRVANALIAAILGKATARDLADLDGVLPPEYLSPERQA